MTGIAHKERFKMKYPLVSVIILNYCGKSRLGELLDDCIDSMLSINYSNFEVLFIDNSSTDRSVQHVKRRYEGTKRLRIIPLNNNYGYAGGNNIATQFLSDKTKYVVFLNPDVVVAPNWLTALVEVMESDPTIGAIQPKILFLKQPQRINSAGMWLTPLGMTQGPAGPHSGFMELDRGQYDNFMEVFSVMGSAFMIRRKLFDKIGGFDFDYFMYGEEIDLCWRIWLCGFRVLYCPFSKVYHFEGGIAGSVTKPIPLRMYYGERNRFLNLLKNYELNNLAKYFIAAILNVAIRKAISSTKNRTPLPSYLYFKALVNIVFTFRNTLRKRLFVNYSIRRISDKELFTKGLIRT